MINAQAVVEADRRALQEELAVLYNNHGSSCKKLGDLAKAIQMYTLALQNQEGITGETQA